MTKPKNCPTCGREDGHYLNCRRAPSGVEPAAVMESVCGEDGCDDPVKSAASKYCVAHSGIAAAQARSYRKRKENDND